MSKRFCDSVSWTVHDLHKMWEVIEKLVEDKYQLEYYEPLFEVITPDQMKQTLSCHGMPTSYNHWSFGKSYHSQQRQWDQGQRNMPYELIIHSDPAVCYLMESNTSVMQVLVMAHAAIGHSSFFKGNYLMREWVHPKVLMPRLVHAREFIEDCERRYGEDRVARLLDSCHALQWQSVDRYKRSRTTSSKKATSKIKDRIKAIQEGEHSEFGNINKGLSITEKDITEWPLPEENILYFFEKNAPLLEPWEREVLRIVRNQAQYFFPNIETKLMNEGWACYQGDTEFLSQTGWKKFKEYEEGDLVAQYHSDGTVDFVSPLEYVRYEEAPLLSIKSEHVNQVVTPNHRMIYRSPRGHINEIRADELTTSCNRYFINYGELSTGTSTGYSEEELRVMVAVIADGFFNPNTTTKYCQMGFVKDRKIARMKQLLRAAKIDYKLMSSTQGRTFFSFYAPERLKEFGSRFYKASREELEVIVEEARNWDANAKGGTYVYYSTNKANVDFLQFALSLTGRKASITCRPAQGNRSELYLVRECTSKVSTLSGGSIDKVDGLHDVYCFRVPTGMLVTRNEDVVNISGNTFWHYQICEDLYNEGYLNEGDYLEVLHSHTNVAHQPDGTVASNPYAMGFAMWTDIKRACEEPTEEDYQYLPLAAGKPWLETMKWIMENFKDQTFIEEFLGPNVINEFKMFAVEDNNDENKWKILGTQRSDDIREVRSALAATHGYESCFPTVSVTGVNKVDRTLTLEYKEVNGVKLNPENTTVLHKHLSKLWRLPVTVEYVKEDGEKTSSKRRYL